MSKSNSQHRIHPLETAQVATGRRHQISFCNDERLKSPVLRDSTYLHQILNEGQLLAEGVNASEAVRMVQIGLLKLDPTVELGAGSAGIDGSYGKKTSAAVQAFQVVHSLDCDGIVGPITLRTLDQELIPETAEISTGELNRESTPRPALEGAEEEDTHSKSFIKFVEKSSVDPKCGVKWEATKLNKVSKSIAATEFGLTSMSLEIEYAQSASGIVVGCLKVSSVVQIFMDQFRPLEEFESTYNRLYTHHAGNLETFSKDPIVRSFSTEESTTRHEFLHVASYESAARDLEKWFRKEYIPDFCDTWERFGGAAKHFWEVNWKRTANEIMPHEEIYLLDAKTLVAEYKRRFL